MNADFEKAAGVALDAGAEHVMAGNIPKLLNVGPLKFGDGKRFKVRDVLEGASSTIEGYLLEAVLGSVADMKTQMPDTKSQGIRADFDFPRIVRASKK